MKTKEIYESLVTRKKIKSTYHYLEQSAIEGDSLSRAILGVEYFNKDYKKLNNRKAAKWLKEYVEVSKPQRKWSLVYEHLGRCYLNGFGVKISNRKSMDCFQIASSFNREISMHYLGDFYFYGMGIRKNYRLAYYWYKKASKSLEDSNLLLHLGFMKNYGLGTIKNRSEARVFYEMSARLKHQDAKYNLILMDVEDKDVSAKTIRSIRSLIKSSYKKSKTLTRILEKYVASKK